MSNGSYEDHARRIDQIDRLLEPAAKSLLSVMKWEIRNAPKNGSDGLPENRRVHVGFPTWLSDERQPSPRKSQLTTALCAHTLQRLHALERRHPWFDRPYREVESLLQSEARVDDELVKLLARAFLPVRESKRAERLLSAARDFVRTDEIGFPDPLTASQVMWVLMRGGEQMTHSSTGYYSFFTIVASLKRTFPDRISGGASIGTEPPNSYVTAKCLAPLRELGRVCRRRARIFQSIKRRISEIDQEMERSKDGIVRMLPIRLDALAGELRRCAPLAIDPEDFQSCAEWILRASGRLAAETPGLEHWREVVSRISEMLQRFGRTADRMLAAPGRLVGALEAKQKEDWDSMFEWLDSEKRLRLPVTSSDRAAVNAAANGAVEILRNAHEQLLREGRIARDRRAAKHDVPALLQKLDHVKTTNLEVAKVIEGGIRPAEEACESAFYRQMAYASSKSFTALDAGEAVGALWATVNAGRMDSSLLFAESLKKILLGQRGDGSWIAGNLFYPADGMTAPTSDIVWMLAAAAGGRHRDVREADSALESYVDWLERTRITLPTVKTSSAEREGDARLLDRVTGWVSDVQTEPRRVDLWVTALAINALLQVRDLQENRIWEASRERFTVVEPERALEEIDSVDLGARHQHRLHRYLTENIRKCEEGEPDAEYSVIIHGPPGSSKTAIASAVAREMWKGGREGSKARMIRITPADFTRQGEQRLDSEARTIFEMLQRLRGVMILFDEIDDLLRRRGTGQQLQFLELVVPAMLNRLQDLRDVCSRQELFFVLATNYIDQIEPALIRKGRIDRPIPLVYPDRQSRLGILDRHSKVLAREVKASVERHLERTGWKGRPSGVGRSRAVARALRGLLAAESCGLVQRSRERNDRDDNRKKNSSPWKTCVKDLKGSMRWWSWTSLWVEPREMEVRLADDIARWAAQYLRVELASEDSWPAACWPWMDVDAFYRAAREIVHKHILDALEDREQLRSIHEEIDARFAEHEAGSSFSPYDDRLKDLKRSAELRDEMIYFELARTDDRSKFIKNSLEVTGGTVRRRWGRTRPPSDVGERVRKRAETIWASQERGAR